MPWYVLYTKPNNEKKLEKKLLERGINVYCPVIKELKIWSDRKKQIAVPLFKSYIFVNLSNYSVENSSVLCLPGAVKFIWWLGKPAIVKDEEINKIILFLFKYENCEISTSHPFNEGDQVRIIDGPFIGKQGKFLSKSGKYATLEIGSIGWKIVAKIQMSSIERGKDYGIN